VLWLVSHAKKIKCLENTFIFCELFSDECNYLIYCEDFITIGGLLLLPRYWWEHMGQWKQKEGTKICFKTNHMLSFLLIFLFKYFWAITSFDIDS